MKNIIVTATPSAITIDLTRTALILIDMQRDFIEAGGFGETLGNDVRLLNAAIAPCQRLLTWARSQGLLIIHTREGHLPDLSDAHPAKLERGNPSLRIGETGPMGRILIRGETGHDIIPALYPLQTEVVIDKPGKGAFYATALESLLKNNQIKFLIICGVTTEVCVQTTVREANDRGFYCLVPGDCCASYSPEFHTASLRMITAQGGIFGWVTESAHILNAPATSSDL